MTTRVSIKCKVSIDKDANMYYKNSQITENLQTNIVNKFKQIEIKIESNLVCSVYLALNYVKSI